MGTKAGDRIEAMQFQGTYSEADLDALAKFVVSQSLDQRITRATLVGAGLIGVIAILLRSWPLAIAGFIGVMLISLLARYVFFPRLLLRHAGPQHAPENPRSILIDEREIRHLSSGQEQVYAKPDIRKAVMTKAYLFLLFKPHGLLMLPLSWIPPSGSVEDVAIFLARRPS
jgi:hypothetical protein